MSFLKDILNQNKYFLYYACVWVVLGLILLLSFTQEQLFYFLNSHHNPFLDHLMTAFSAWGRADAMLIIFLSVFCIPALRQAKYLVQICVFAILISLSIQGLKQLYACPRPLVEYGVEQVHTVNWLTNFYHYSFPSGHTFGAFSFFFFLTYLIPQKNPFWQLLFFILALATGLSRIYLGQHFFKDVYVGSILGILTCILSLWISNFILHAKNK
ncbi:MAG: phosphatase PAP2 family protein [Chitinophagaceae bacterium]